MTKLKITENDVRRVVRDYLRLRGWFVFHILQGLGSYKGTPDLIAVNSGRVLFIELKKPVGWKHSDPQKQFQKDIREHNGEYHLIKCLEDIIEVVG